MVPVAILGFRETCYFSAPGSSADLRQWIMVDLENRSDRTIAATAVMEAGGRTASASLQIQPGIHSYRCYAPGLPRGTEASEAPLTIEGPGCSVRGLVTAGSYRPWTIHLLSDDCPDYLWGYGTELSYLADCAAVTEAELRVADVFSSQPEWNRNRYSFAVAREVQVYEQSHGEGDNERLFGRIREGSFTLNPIPTMSLSCSQGLEDMIRGLYLARRWERERGIRIAFANHQETPTAAWALASVLAGSGIPCLVKGILPFGTPWTARLAEPPVFLWEGPDGARILVRRHNLNYNEGAFVLRDVAAINQAVERRVVPQYEALGGAYPFDHIGLVGCYSDLNGETRSLPLRKATNIAQYNAQGWDYPRLVNSCHELFWSEIQRQPMPELSAHRGDYGASWEVWLLTLANLFARWRRLQERGPLADRLRAIAQALEPDRITLDAAPMDRGWDDLVSLSDHAWNGADGPNRSLNLALRRSWAERAQASFDGVIAGALSAIARHAEAPGERAPGGQASGEPAPGEQASGRQAPGEQASGEPVSGGRTSGEQASGRQAPGERAAIVMNGLGWKRSTLACLEPPFPEGTVVVDAATGTEASSQLTRRDGRSFLELQAADLPPLGYRTYRLRAGRPKGQPAVSVRGMVLESPFHRLEIDPGSGGIRSLRSKALQRELVRPGDSLNRWLYRREGDDETVRVQSVEPGTCGPVYGEMRVSTRSAHVEVLTTIRLYAAMDRIELRHDVRRPTTDQRESLHFLFPFAVPQGRFRFEAPGAIVRAGEVSQGGEQLPGSGQAYTAIRHFADVSNDQFGVTLSQADSGFIQFGHRTETEDPVAPAPDSSLVAFVLDNTVNYAEVTRDQGGEASFTFRFAIREHGPFDPAEAVRFAWEDNNEALVSLLPDDPDGGAARAAGPRVAGAVHSFLSVSGPGVVLVNLKPTEEDPHTGVVVRLWNVAEQGVESTVQVSSAWKLGKAWLADLLERPKAELRVSDNSVKVEVGARGYATVILRR